MAANTQAGAAPSSAPPVVPAPTSGALPFPDLTGLRASAYDRVTSPDIVTVTRNVAIPLDSLSAAAARLSDRHALSAEHLVAGAWTIVLVCLLKETAAVKCHVSIIVLT